MVRPTKQNQVLRPVVRRQLVDVVDDQSPAGPGSKAYPADPVALSDHPAHFVNRTVYDEAALKCELPAPLILTEWPAFAQAREQ